MPTGRGRGRPPTVPARWWDNAWGVDPMDDKPPRDRDVCWCGCAWQVHRLTKRWVHIEPTSIERFNDPWVEARDEHQPALGPCMTITMETDETGERKQVKCPCKTYEPETYMECWRAGWFTLDKLKERYDF